MSCVISVIIPTYCHKAFVVETLESVFAQTVADFELIVINDGSPDDTAAVLGPYVDSGRIRYFEQSNAGQAAARNRGLAEAKGEFIAFLDDDDLWPQDSLEWRVAALREHPDWVAVGGFASLIDEQGRHNLSQQGKIARVDRPFLYNETPFTSPGQVLIRRSALDQVGGFDASVWGADDLDLYFRLAAVGNVQLIDRLALHYRCHPTNASRDKARMLRVVKGVFRRHLAIEPRALQRRFRQSSNRFLYRYTIPPIIAEIRGHLRRGRLLKAAKRFVAMRPLGAAIVTDPVLLYAFCGAWFPRDQHTRLDDLG